MFKVIRTDSTNKDFIMLVQQLDAYLAMIDGDDHKFYAQFNKTDHLKHVVLISIDDLPIGCGAMREIEPGIMEIKRMYTLPEHRGKGVAKKVLSELERWAAELSIKKCVLETGMRQPEAIAVYKKNGYNIIENYGQYTNMDNSVCFEKLIS